MRKIEYNGKVAYITEKEWRSLVNRFDKSRARVADGDIKYIKSKCVLCNRYIGNNYCDNYSKCPLTLFKDKGSSYLGCVILVSKLLGEDYYITITRESIEWRDDKTSLAEMELDIIRNALLGLEYVPRKVKT